MTTRRDARASQMYAGVVIAIGVLVLIVRLPAQVDQPLLFLALLAASMVMSASKVRLPIKGGMATLSMSYFTDLLALMLVGADQAMITAAASAITQCYVMSQSRPRWYRPLFSAAVLIIAIQLAGVVGSVNGGFQLQSVRDLSAITLAAGAVLYLVNSALVAVAIARARGASIFRTWYHEFLWTAPACLVGAVVAALLVYAASSYLWAALLAMVPLSVTSKAYRLYADRLREQQSHVQEVSNLHLASVEALARAIDARDQTIDSVRSGTNHIRRVQAWAVALAEAAGMRDGDLEAVRVAALLHDIGKLAVPEHILTKPGRLTAKEFARVRIHPVVGAEIIKAVPFPYPVASFIRSHHERWDGSGYPDGLRGDTTPLGARVLAVVDYFDALTSARPYHAAVERTDAIATLRAEAGRALDPTLVELFLEVLPTLERVEVQRDCRPAPAVPRGEPTVGVVDDQSEPGWVFHNISLATQEMRALYDIAQTLGTRLSVADTMALLSAKLGRLMPGSSWVLYLHDAEEDVLRYRLGTGVGAAGLEGLVVPSGEGPSGWAARHRATVVNACAAADFVAASATLTAPPFLSAISCALVHDEHLIGVLTIYDVEKDVFCEEHRHLLDHISSQVASVLSNALAFERVRDASLTDPLTGLPNSRALHEFLRKGPTDPLDDETAYAFVMIDVDGFKTINDEQGHAAGDVALQALAAIMRQHIRGSDFFARWGGDEFIVALPGCNRLLGELRAADLQQAVEGALLNTVEGPRRLSISVGVSASPDDGSTVSELIAAADKRMYVDKAQRREVLASSAIDVSWG